jgi:hypothetical protein
MHLREHRKRLIERAIARRDKLYALRFDLGAYPLLKVQAAVTAQYRCEEACALIETAPEIEAIDQSAPSILFLCSSAKGQDALAGELGEGFEVSVLSEEEALGFPYSLQEPSTALEPGFGNAAPARAEASMAFLLLLSRLLIERCESAHISEAKELVGYIDSRIGKIGGIDFVFSLEGEELVAYPAGSEGAARAEREGRGLYEREVEIGSLRATAYDGRSLSCEDAHERFKMMCCVGA